MKKIMFILILVSSLWSEEIKIDDIYEVYISKTVDIDLKGSSKEEVFFGKYKEWTEKQTEALKTMEASLLNGAANGASTAANGVANSVANTTGKALGQGLGMGLGIGVVYGLIGVGYQMATANEIYILINDYTNSKGEKSRVLAFYCAKSFDDEPVVKSFLEQEMNKKYLIKG